MNRYPWPKEIGEVSEFTSDKKLSAVRSAAGMYALSQERKTGVRPRYRVELLYSDGIPPFKYKVERIA
jgi:hypothetical protein